LECDPPSILLSLKERKGFLHKRVNLAEDPVFDLPLVGWILPLAMKTVNLSTALRRSVSTTDAMRFSRPFC